MLRVVDICVTLSGSASIATENRSSFVKPFGSERSCFAPDCALKFTVSAAAVHAGGMERGHLNEHLHQSSRTQPGTGAEPLSAGNPQVPAAGAGRGIHAGQALGRPSGRGGRAQDGDLAPAPRRQDRHGLSRLRPAAGRGDLRGERRPDAGGQAVRPRKGLPPCDLCDVVDPRQRSRNTSCGRGAW